MTPAATYAAGATRPLPWPELIAIAVGFVSVRRTGNVLHAITVGLPALWLLTAITALTRTIARV